MEALTRLWHTAISNSKKGANVQYSLCILDIFWVNLTVESSFLVRVFTEFCRRKDDDAQFDKVVPEVVRHAFYIQKYSNIMQQAEEEDRPEAEFIVTQLLMIARLLDYADEIGRRKMFGLLRKLFPVPTVNYVVHVLRQKHGS